MLCLAASLSAQSTAPAGQGGQSALAPESLEGYPLQQVLDARSQRPTGTFDPAEGILKLDVEVTDPSGKAVTGLEAKDFSLVDNGQPDQIVTLHAFDGAAAFPNPAVEVVLVIDEMNQSAEQVAQVDQEVSKFLRRNGGHLDQPVSIYRFFLGGISETPQALMDGNVLAEELAAKNKLNTVWPKLDKGSVGVWIAPSASFAYRNQISLTALGAMILEERRKPGRKLMVWLGGGWPLLNDKSVDSFDWVTEFSTRLREARITLSSVTAWPYPVRESPYQNFLQGIQSARKTSDEYLIQSLGLEVLATQSGGHVVEPGPYMADQIGLLVKEANDFYTISFDPPRTEQVDEYHELKVRLAKPGLTARTTSGYYDEPAYYEQPVKVAERVPVDRLEEVLDAARGKSDSDFAEELSGMGLTERLSGSKLAAWKARMPGAKSSAAFVALADASTFLDPPAERVLPTPAPDLAAQRLTIAKTVDYLSKSIPRLPNFYAIRRTARYRETEQKDEQIWKTAMGDQRVHSEAISTATVLYRNGFDVVDAEAVKGKKPKKERSMDTKGTFGPILTTVILDVAHGDLRWSRWEQGAGGVRAVFRYAVPKEQSHYELSYCCLTEGDGNRMFKLKPGYHGELVIDPESGAILRLTVEADLEPRLPLMRSNIMVQYGPETIGGSTYICPERSVSLWRGRRNVQVNEWGESFRVFGPFETMLDDVSFGDYHMFRGEAHILTGYDPEPEGTRGDSGAGGTSTGTPKTKP